MSYLKNNNFDLVEVIDCFNGLLLCCRYNSLTFIKSYIICNPFTKDHVLPRYGRLFIMYCLLIPHILTICNIRLFVFVTSKKKKSLHLYCLFFHGRWVSERVLMSNFYHYLTSTKWVQMWCLTMIYFGIVLRSIFLHAT